MSGPPSSTCRRGARRPARRHRAGGAGPLRPARPADADAQAAGRHQVRFPRKQRLRRDRLPLGQPHQRACAGRRAASAASCWECPISNSTCAPAPRSASPASIARSWARSPPWSRTAAGAKPACRWARSNTGISARPTRRSSPTTATTRRSTSPISPAPIGRLKALGLLTSEINDHEYRFRDVVDLDTREVLFTVEHEVRSQTHPMYGRPLVNRNPGADGPRLPARP